jgi:hypothetical protein
MIQILSSPVIGFKVGRCKILALVEVHGGPETERLDEFDYDLLCINVAFGDKVAGRQDGINMHSRH